jgi:hypothetical protein
MPRMVWLYSISTVVVIVIGVLVVGTVRRGRGPVHCPNCVTPMSARRRPVFGSQTLFGGWVCPHCGTKMDKWGRDVSRVNEAGAGSYDHR